MKMSLRNMIGNKLLGWLIWAYMALCSRTIRWTVEGESQALKVWQSSPGIIFAAWHSTLMLLPAGWNRIIRRWPQQKKRMAMLVSRSRDGEPVAMAAGHLGVDAIRGSSAHKGKKRDKGGAQALWEVIRLLKDGGGICITPDGPRGPAEIVQPGPVIISQRTRVPILPYIVVSSPRTRLKTWDKLCIPYPFTRGVVIFGEAVVPSPDDDCDMLCKRLQDNLASIMARAEHIRSC